MAGAHYLCLLAIIFIPSLVEMPIATSAKSNIRFEFPSLICFLRDCRIRNLVALRLNYISFLPVNQVDDQNLMRLC